MSRPRTPGLDLDHLRSMRAARRRDVDGLVEAVGEHLDEHGGYVALSGGKDSLVVLDLARRVDKNVPVAYFDSGLAYPETYAYLDQLVEVWDLNFHVYRADPPLLHLLAGSGIFDHHDPETVLVDVFDAIIARPSTAAHAVHGPGELWGVRAAESAGRAAAYARANRKRRAAGVGACGPGVIERLDKTVAYGPIWDWSTADVWTHIRHHKLPVNPVYAKLAALGVREEHRRVGNLVDGAGLERGRMTWLKAGWPALFNDLAAVLPRIREWA